MSGYLAIWAGVDDRDAEVSEIAHALTDETQMADGLSAPKFVDPDRLWGS